MNRLPHLAVLLLCACSADPEAAESKESGRVDLSWLVPDGCDDAGVTDVDVLVDGEHLDVRSCDEGALVARVGTGLHLVRLEGVDRFGVPRYAAEAAVTVERGELVPVPTLVLGALPAEVEISWYFENARLCSHNGVVEIDAAAFEDGSSVAAVTAGCDQGVAVLRDLRAGQYLLDVVGRDHDGRALFHGEHQLDVGKGEVTAIEVELATLER